MFAQPRRQTYGMIYIFRTHIGLFSRFCLVYMRLFWETHLSYLSAAKLVVFVQPRRQLAVSRDVCAFTHVICFIHVRDVTQSYIRNSAATDENGCAVSMCADMSECSKLCCIATCLRDYMYYICIHIISYYTCDTTHSSTRHDSFAHEKFRSHRQKRLCCIATCLRDYIYDICIHIISYYTGDTNHSSTRHDSFAHEKFRSHRWKQLCRDMESTTYK